MQEKLIYKKEFFNEKVVEWDDIPKAIQKKLSKLEKELEDQENFSKDKKRIKSIKAEIEKLEKPYTK